MIEHISTKIFKSLTNNVILITTHCISKELSRSLKLRNTNTIDALYNSNLVLKNDSFLF